MTRPRPLCAGLLALLLLLLVRLPVHAAGQPDSAQLQVEPQPGGVRLRWSASGAVAAAAGSAGWRSAELGGVAVPAQLVALHVPGAAPVVPVVQTLERSRWQGTAPKALESDAAGPEAPLTVVREGRFRGVRIVVVALAQLYQERGVWYAVSSIAATVPGATLADPDALRQAPTLLPGAVLPTPNPLAGRAALRVVVTQAGIQQLTGAAIAASGFDITDIDPSRLQLWHGGAPVALDARGTGDGRLDAGDELRFYAAAPGDRWNAGDTYWLTVEPSAGLRMAQRAVPAGSAPLRTVGVERGVWQPGALYDSTLAGPDGDHWFAADLRATPGQPSAPLDVPLASNLQAVAGTVQLVITGSAYTGGTHQLQVTLGGASVTQSWSGRGDWTRSFTLPQNGATARLTLLAGSAADGVEIDAVRWERSANLRFGGDASFTGAAGTARYQLEGLPAGATLYDIGDPAQPQILATATGSTLVFEDGPAARTYAVAGLGTLAQPNISRYEPADLLMAANVDLVYIAPAAFQTALEPLLALRRAQGHTAAAFDVQQIYDTWSDGQVSPAAIREFLRYAAATWSRPPVAATLVGDGTSDPLNHTGRNNTNWIPPYLAPVDPWLGETACETCYGQLDGADPLSDPLPDIAIGRLPVKSVAEVETVVAKLARYDAAPQGSGWRATTAFIADNADGAGDFATYADAAAALQPAGVAVERMYYDPSASGSAWREPNALQAYRRTLGVLNAGAGVVNYIGHSNHWQWAVTDPTTNPGTLLSMYDVDTLTNGERLPVLLEMTCYTSAFQQPAYSGTTIDERFVLSPSGGAVAVWGPTGLGIAHGHDALQRGFYAALWAADAGDRALGTLTTAGYLELFMHGGCCQDTLRTFALLGDPATQLRVLAAHRVWLPSAQR